MAKKDNKKEHVQVYSTRKGGYHREGNHFSHRPVRYTIIDAPAMETDAGRKKRWSADNPSRGLTQQEIERIDRDVKRTPEGIEPGLRVLHQDVGNEVLELEQLKNEIRAAVAKLEETRQATRMAKQERKAAEDAASQARVELAKAQNQLDASNAAIKANEAKLGK